MLFKLILVVYCMVMSGCVPAFIAGTGAAAAVVSDNRSGGNIIDDITISNSIKKSLLIESGRLFARVNVEVKEGRVLLTGNVMSYEDQMKAVEIAWSRDGVKEVINEISVAEVKLYDFAKDSLITSQIKTKFLLSDKIHSINYSVQTLNGVVYLFGKANSEQELETAIKLAKRVPNVNKVVSHVRIKKTNKASAVSGGDTAGVGSLN